MMKLRALYAVNQRTTKAGTFLLEHQKVCINLLQRSFILLIKPRFNVIKHDTVPMQLIYIPFSFYSRSFTVYCKDKLAQMSIYSA